MNTRTFSLRTVLLAAAATAFASAAQAEGITNRTIGYVLTEKHWAVYQTADAKAECPNGFNDGPREQFKVLYPEDGKKRTLMETQFAREADSWFPAENEPAGVKGTLPYLEAGGKIAMGLNLDGKVGPNDFTSPQGEPGIDNQLYRAVGCVAGFRGPEGAYTFFMNDYMQRYIFDRVLIEITDVDDLTNDPDVTVTTYRGLNPLLTSANGKDFIAGGTQKADERWGKRYIHSFKGKIVDGVLTTEVGDTKLPYADTFDTNVDQTLKAARFRLRLTAAAAEGLIGTYLDVKEFHHQFAVNWATHHASYGQMSIPSITRAMRRLADGYPDPATGKNTAISAALDLKFVQAFILHGDPKKAPVAAAQPTQKNPVAAAQ
ncbi:MAG: hypothetical protein ACYCZX_08860 [Rhodospirillaceae bacterium]